MILLSVSHLLNSCMAFARQFRGLGCPVFVVRLQLGGDKRQRRPLELDNIWVFDVRRAVYSIRCQNSLQSCAKRSRQPPQKRRSRFLILYLCQAFILSLIEGLTIAMNRMQGESAKPQLPEMPEDMLGAPPAPSPQRGKALFISSPLSSV